MNNKIDIIKKSIRSALENLDKVGVDSDFINILDSFFNEVIECIKRKKETHERYMSQGMNEEEARERELRDFLDELGISMKNYNNPLPITFHDDIRDCISRVLNNGKDRWICGEDFDKNFSDLPCGETLMAHAWKGWKFTNHKFGKNLISYWLKCFNKNKYTAIFSDSYDGAKFPHFQRLFIDTYVSGGKHQVVFFMYDEKNGFLVKFP